MVKAQSTVTINQPANVIFDWMVGYYAQNLAQWSPSVQQVQQTSPGPIGVGSTFYQVRLIRGKPVASNLQVTELQPPYRFVTQAQGEEQRVVAAYIFQPVGPSSTQVTIDLDVEGGFPRMAGPMVSREIKKETEDDLNRVKAILGG